MLDQVKRSTLPGELYSVSGNTSIVLNDLESVWIVDSGAFAIFAVPSSDSTIAMRRYLFTVRSGQAMFPIASEQSHQLVAVSIEASHLIKVSRQTFCHSLSDDPVASQFPNGGIALLENWIEQIGSIFTDIIPPVISYPKEGVRYFSLHQGEIFQPQIHHIAWVQLESGAAKLLGFEPLRITPQTGLIPFSSNLWIQADLNLEFAAIDTAEIPDSDLLMNGLMQLQSFVLHGLEQIEQQEQTAEWIRFHDRQRLNDQVMQETLGELASFLHSSVSRPTAPDSDQALLVAAGAVGHFLGVTIHPPAKSEDLDRVIDPIEAIARASRLRVRRITLQGQWWKKDCGALLAYTEDNQPVALLPGSDNRYEMFDPQVQQRIALIPNNTKLAPTAYMFYRPLPDQILRTWDLLRFALWGHYKELIIVLVTGIATTLLGMLTPQATAILIDNAIPDANRRLLIQIALGLSAVAFGSTLFQLAQGFAILRIETFADSSTQAAVWDRLLGLKPAFFRQYAIGDLNSRVSAIRQIRQKLSSTVLKSIFSSAFALFNLGLLFYYSSSLAAIALVVAILNIGCTIISGVLALKKFRPLIELEGQLFGIVVQLIASVTKLRVAGAESRAFAYWGKHYGQQIKLMLSTQSIEDCLAVINTVLPALTTGVLFWFAAGLIEQSQTGELSTGTFIAFNAAFGTFISGATSLSNSVVAILQVIPLWNRAQPILEAKPEVDRGKADPGRLAGQLVVDHVVFRYRNDGPLILDDVSITAKPGAFIALVGASGSGKSTLFRLLLGFEAPESGTIYYDGQDLSGLDVHAVRRQLGVVMQNSRVMSASIFDNIASGVQITIEEAWEAARLAGFAEDIESMPMGLHTVISEGGANLSGGQRQRLLIARSLVLKPKILLFDEATSALDNRTQAIVSQSLEQLNVTRIAIAHRLSTIRNADRIYVFHAGRIVQQGTFTQLETQEGIFAELMARQKL